MAGYTDSDALPEPWVRNDKGFFNPVTGQLFKTTKDLDRYLAYAERSKVPRECKLRALNGESSLTKGNVSLETEPKSRTKKRMRSPFAPLVISETKAMTSNRNVNSRTKKAATTSDEKGKTIKEVESDDGDQSESDDDDLFNFLS
ncbi:hypothetical protein AKJ16_DCAP15919 [Drosera capensis]